MNRPTAPESRLMNTKEASQYIRLAVRTLEKLRLNGGGPRYRKVGRLVFYTMDDLDDWVESHTYAMTSDPDYPALRSA